jgi:hypothetical protein
MAVEEINDEEISRERKCLKKITIPKKSGRMYAAKTGGSVAVRNDGENCESAGASGKAKSQHAALRVKA